MKRKMFFILAMVTALVMSSTFVYAKPIMCKAHLSNETPTTMTRGTGIAMFVLSDEMDEMTFKLIVANIKDVTMAHIHVAATPGGDGAPAVWLYPDDPPAVLIPGRTQGILNMGTFTAADFIGPLAGMTMQDLLTAIDEGRAYVNVHTTAYPGGEIRGTIG
ncbi:MAG: CHRD domain-containing protein [Saccharofermentanales bacterium]